MGLTNGMGNGTLMPPSAGGSGGSTYTSVSTTGTDASYSQSIYVNASAGAVVRTLPAASAALNSVLIYWKMDLSINPVTIVPAGSDTINGVAFTSSLYGLQNRITIPNHKIIMVSNGVNGWEASYDEPVSHPEDFGALGLGSAHDDSTAVNAMIAWYNAMNTALLPECRLGYGCDYYMASAPTVWTVGVKMTGHGRTNSGFSFGVGITGFQFGHYTGSTTLDVELWLSNLYLLGGGLPGVTLGDPFFGPCGPDIGLGLGQSLAFNCRLDNISISKFGAHGIYFGTDFNSFNIGNNVIVQACGGHALFCGPSMITGSAGVNNNSTNWIWNNCQFIECGGFGACLPAPGWKFNGGEVSYSGMSITSCYALGTYSNAAATFTAGSGFYVPPHPFPTSIPSSDTGPYANAQWIGNPNWQVFGVGIPQGTYVTGASGGSDVVWALSQTPTGSGTYVILQYVAPDATYTSGSPIITFSGTDTIASDLFFGRDLRDWATGFTPATFNGATIVYDHSLQLAVVSATKMYASINAVGNNASPSQLSIGPSCAAYSSTEGNWVENMYAEIHDDFNPWGATWKTGADLYNIMMFGGWTSMTFMENTAVSTSQVSLPIGDPTYRPDLSDPAHSTPNAALFYKVGNGGMGVFSSGAFNVTTQGSIQMRNGASYIEDKGLILAAGPPIGVNALVDDIWLDPNGIYWRCITANTSSVAANWEQTNLNYAATTTVAIVSGTAWQNTSNQAVKIYVPVTYAPTATPATLAAGIGSTATPTQISPYWSEPAALTGDSFTRTHEFSVPANYYLLLTAVNATIGTARLYPG